MSQLALAFFSQGGGSFTLGLILSKAPVRLASENYAWERLILDWIVNCMIDARSLGDRHPPIFSFVSYEDPTVKELTKVSHPQGL